MRISRPLALAGAAALVAGIGVAAIAEKPKEHVMRVALPDGSVQQIRYTGDTPPRLVVADQADPFAAFDRMAAEMDAQMVAMMGQAEAMQRAAFASGGNGHTDGVVATGGAMPSDSQFSYVSTTTVNGKTCTTRVRQVAGKAGEQPQMLRQVSGDGCSGSAVQTPQGLTPTALPSAPKAPAAPIAPKAPTVPADTI